MAIGNRWNRAPTDRLATPLCGDAPSLVKRFLTSRSFLTVPLIAPELDASDAEWSAFFEGLGESELRRRINTGGWPQTLLALAMKWLDRRDQESERLKLASQAEQIEIARSAKDAAWAAARAAERAATAAEAANRRATIAIVTAVVSIIITITGLLLVHWDAMHPISHG